MRAAILRFLLAWLALLTAAPFTAMPAHAQKFPSKPIHVILPFAVGGLLDATVRAIGQNLSQSVGQPVLVENKPGGGTFIGMEACARATPDGYTICVTTPDSLVYNPYLYTQVPYDAEKDFVPVTNLVFINSIIVAAGNAPFNTFKEMIAYAKANPGKVTWATWGAGSIPHVYLEAVIHAFNVDILQVPYKGAGQAYPAVLSGEAQVTYGGLGWQAQAAGNDARPFAVGARRADHEGARGRAGTAGLFRRMGAGQNAGRDRRHARLGTREDTRAAEDQRIPGGADANPSRKLPHRICGFRG
jgi:tripartite-type tricarboxylate transporter receptor subunit TctC